MENYKLIMQSALPLISLHSICTHNFCILKDLLLAYLLEIWEQGSLSQADGTVVRTEANQDPSTAVPSIRLSLANVA